MEEAHIPHKPLFLQVRFPSISQASPVRKPLQPWSTEDGEPGFKPYVQLSLKMCPEMSEASSFVFYTLDSEWMRPKTRLDREVTGTFQNDYTEGDMYVSTVGMTLVTATCRLVMNNLKRGV